MIQSSYNVDFDSTRQDLQLRAFQRMLVQFRKSPVLLQILWALVSQIQELSDGIVDVMKFSSLYHAAGVNQDVLGRLVGQPRVGWSSADYDLLTEDGLVITTEDPVNLLVSKEYALPALDDDSYQTLLLLRISCNFNRYSSIPELTAAIKQATGIGVLVQKVGPSAIDLLVAPITDPKIVDMLERVRNTDTADNSFLFAYPATSQVRVVFNKSLVTESGQSILSEDGMTQFITENIPL